MTKTSDKIEFNEAQAKAWPTLCSEIVTCIEEEHSRLVNVPDDPNHFDWQISRDPGDSFYGIWDDGDFLAHFAMNGNGEYSLGITELVWFHISSTTHGTDECKCAACYPSRVQEEDEPFYASLAEMAKREEAMWGVTDPDDDPTDPFYVNLAETLRNGESLADQPEIPNKHAKVYSTPMDLGDDPLDPHGDGTIEEGDPVYSTLMEMLKTGQPVVANRREDGLWDVEVPSHRSLPEVTTEDSDLPLPKHRKSWWARFKEWLSE